ncbi:DUF1127 domain-containing protein [Pseudorhodobacter turbinis]|nr:DUF1127 domain-containing protein [Pseudorhodobacter turbinis]
MNPVQSYPQAISVHRANGGLIRRWMGLSVRKWQQRKMIAAFNALDNWILQDIGIERCDIERIVKGFDERELQMIPLAPPKANAQIDQSFRRAT